MAARPYDTFLLANYPSGAVDIGEGIVLARDVEHQFRAFESFSLY